MNLQSQDQLKDNLSSLQFETQVHKGREQFWSLLLVAINILVTAVITLAMMEIGENVPTDIGNLLRCSPGREKSTLRWWFHSIDRYQYIIGKGRLQKKNGIMWEYFPY